MAYRHFISTAAEFNFGKHRGRSLSDVIERDPSYIYWCANTIPEFSINYRTILEIEKLFPNFILSQEFIEKVCDYYELPDEAKLYRAYFNRFMESESFDEEEHSNYSDDFSDDWQNESPSYGRYSGSWAQDVEGYSDDDIDTIFDGDPSAYWNID